MPNNNVIDFNKKKDEKKVEHLGEFSDAIDGVVTAYLEGMDFKEMAAVMANRMAEIINLEKNKEIKENLWKVCVKLARNKVIK